VAVSSFSDLRGLRAALSDVDTVFHLASSESQGRNATLYETDMKGTENLSMTAAETGVERFVFLSHIGAARASGYPVFKAKGVAEESIRKSRVPYTIIRSTIVYGEEDHFTRTLARLLRYAPFVFPIPATGRTVLQPIWVEDLVTCMLWALDNPQTLNQTYDVGGIEYLTLNEVLETIMEVTHTSRYLLTLSPVILRALTVTLESSIPNFPISSFWLDYLAVNRTCPVDSVSRNFSLMPARFVTRIDYLQRRSLFDGIRSLFTRKTND
jgi:NADH dehydrogenase